MANICIDYVQLYGERAEEAVKMLEALSARTVPGLYTLPEFIQDRELGFGNIETSEKTQFKFDSIHGPAIPQVRELAEHYNLEYCHDYQESMAPIYGRCGIRNGVFYNIELCGDDYLLFDEDNEDEDGTYPFRDGRFTMSDIIDTLLNERVRECTSNRLTDEG